MKFLSLFSGIGGFDLGFERAGMECVSVCEIDKNAQSVLRRHFPKAQLFGDIRTVGIATHERKSIDLICGGFPCQDLSIAGRRAGLAGKRSGLWFEFARVIDELEPRWVVIENVPGLLSSDRGKDFAVILQWMAQRGYGVTWRILNAQYFGIPQRRRRVFIVASFRDGRSAEVLFESEISARYLDQGRTKKKEVARPLTASSSASGRYDPSNETFLVVGALQAHSPKHGHAMTTQQAAESGQLIAFNWQSGGDMRLGISDKAMLQSSQTPAIAFMGGQGAKAGSIAAGPLSPTLKGAGGGNQVPMLVWDSAQITSKQHGSKPSEISQPLNTLAGMMVGVRRLTPTECERLQGFPDGWTDGQSDSARYRQLGNAIAVPVAEWIGRRIMEIVYEM